MTASGKAAIGSPDSQSGGDLVAEGRNLRLLVRERRQRRTR